MDVLRWIGIVAWGVVAGLQFRHGSNNLTERGTPARWVIAEWGWAALFASFAVVLLRRGGLRWFGIVVFAWFASAGLTFGIFYLRDGFTEGVPWSLGAAVVFAALAAVLLLRGRRRSAPQTGNGQLS